MLSRAKPAIPSEGDSNAASKAAQESKKTPRLETFIQERDYMGAVTLLEVKTKPFKKEKSKQFGLIQMNWNIRSLIRITSYSLTH